MMLRATVIITISSIFVIHSFAGVDSTRLCYSCYWDETVNNTDCLDPVNPDLPVVDCEGQGYCFRLSFVSNGSYYVFRNCDTVTRVNDLLCYIVQDDLFELDPNVKDFQCYACGTDYCNNQPPNNTFILDNNAMH